MKKLLLTIITSLLLLLVGCSNNDNKSTKEDITSTTTNDNKSEIVTTKESNYFDAIYNIQSAYIDNDDVTNEYDIFRLTFKKDGTLEVLISKNGLLRRRNSTYEVNQSTIRVFIFNI